MDGRIGFAIQSRRNSQISTNSSESMEEKAKGGTSRQLIITE